MNKILVIGAGRSSSSLIKYLLHEAEKNNWQVTVGDLDAEIAAKKVKGHKHGEAIFFDITRESMSGEHISVADIVVSMLPPALHYKIALDCLKYEKHLVTASYISEEMKALDDKAKNAGLIFLNECGLDPGIDHMSAMQVIDCIKEQNGKLTSFTSYTGGLVAPQSADNPWKYKITWNPRNVVLAGKGTAKYIENSEYKYVPYQRLFSTLQEIDVENYGSFEGYPNRDSLIYRKLYNIKDIPTLLRGTLRYPGYCEAWNLLVKLGLTDDTCQIENSNTLTYKQLVKAFLPDSGGDVKKNLCIFMGVDPDSEAVKKLEWLGLFDDDPIELHNATAADILQDLIEKKWRLEENDKDMIVMQHRFEYKTSANNAETIISSLIVEGEDQTYTAMAKTVGLPLGIAVKHILKGNITQKGVCIPVSAGIYKPILQELEELGIRFLEKTIKN